MIDLTSDGLIRSRAFEFLNSHTVLDPVIDRKVLERGFDYKGHRVPLLGPQGIFKPKALELPISITHSQTGPYHDSWNQDGYLIYSYRGENPNHHDNVGLRRAMENQVPLIYFHRLLPGRYYAFWPVFIIADKPGALCVTVAIDSKENVEPISQSAQDSEPILRRRYATTIARTRLHQRAFRERVLKAYNCQCALCRLRHVELLEAAHILPDKHEQSEPIASNGLSLCAIHHLAYDKNIMGIRPDLTIEIRGDILEEVDGPMLKHGLQEMHNAKLVFPAKGKDRPNANALEERYELFKAL